MSCHLGVVARPKPGGTVCGDAWLRLERPGGGELIAVCDGLGSGEPAWQASEAFVSAVRTHAERSLTDILSACHTALLGTRGAAAALLFIQSEPRRVSYAGVGNIEARTRRTWDFHPLSLRGIVGANTWREPRIYEADYEPGEWLVLHTDGLRGRFDLEYELTRAAQAGGGGEARVQALAENLAIAHARDNDDLTVVTLLLT